MKTLPTDDFLLLSLVNTKLRDEFSSLAAFCDDYECSEETLKTRLANVNYFYDEKLNKFC